MKKQYDGFFDFPDVPCPFCGNTGCNGFACYTGGNEMSTDPLESVVMLYCPKCERMVNQAEPKADHENHRIVGIRGDIFRDSLKRLVGELKRTDRLIQLGGK